MYVLFTRSVMNQLIVQSAHNMAVSDSLWCFSLGKGLERWCAALGALASLVWELCCKAELSNN